MIERIRVSEALGQRIEVEADRTGRTMRAILEGAVNGMLDRVEAARRASMPKLESLIVMRDTNVVVAVYGGRFAGVGIDANGDGYPLVLEWCEWFRDLCRGAGLELR